MSHSELTALVTLILENTGVTDAGVVTWASGAETGGVAHNLQHLNLCRTNVTQQVLVALSNLPRLTALVLEGTKVGRCFNHDVIE